MNSSKLISILQCFSNRQLKKLEDFVASPYFNKKEEITTFYSYLLQYAPDFEEDSMTKENAYRFVFPKENAYDEKLVGYWMSDLLKLLEDFLAQEHLQQNPVQKGIYLLETYNNWQLEKPFQSIIRPLHKLQSSANHYDHQYYYNEFLLHAHENVYFDRQKKHIYDKSLQKAIDNLDLYYLSEKLRYCCEILNRQNVMVSDYELRLMNEILAYLQEDPHDDVPPIAIYTAILRCLLEKGNEQHFKHLKELLKKYAHVFSKQEARDMYLYGVNYCIGKIRSGKEYYRAESLDLYREALRKEIIFEGKYLSPWSFMNIVDAGVGTKEFEWTETFIQSYKDKLAPNFRQNAYAYALAYLYFHQDKFESALELLHEVTFDDIGYSIKSRTLLLRVYYELDEIDPFYSLIDSFKIYMRRNKLLSESRKKIYLNFIKFIARLNRLPKGQNSRLLKIKKQIEATPNTANANWLIEKVNEKLK